MTVPVVIQAVPARLDFVQQVQLPRLGEFVRVAVDEHYTGSWAGMHLAIDLALREFDTEYICLIEDDAYPCDFLPQILDQLVAVEPYQPLLLCTCGKWANISGTSLTIAPWKNGYYNTVGIIYQRELLRGMMDWVDRHVPKDVRDPWWRSPKATTFYRRYGKEATDDQIRNALKNWGDWLMTLYLRAMGRVLISTDPSLLQHLGRYSMVKPGKVSPQKAKNYIGLGDGREIDWTRKDY